MIRTIDFNNLAAGTIVDDEYANIGVSVSAVGGSGDAMTFDSANPTGDDTDLASDTLDGLLIISTDGDTSDPDDHDGGGSVFFDFEVPVWIKFLTLKDIEETGGDSAVIFYDADGNVIDDLPVFPTDDGGEQTLSIGVPGVVRMEVRLEGSGAIDNLVFDDNIISDEGPTAIDDFDSTGVDVPVIVDLRSNDFDAEDPTSALTIVSATSANGTVLNNDNGTVTFTPNAGYEGEAIIDYIVRDTDGNTDEGQAVITVGDGVADTGPTAVDDFDTTPFETAVTVDLRGNDTDPDDATTDLVISDVSSPNGTISNAVDGTVLFTPADGFVGDAIITYTVTDPDGQSDTGTATVTVAAGTAATGPTAVDDFETTDFETPVTVDLRGNDTDPDDATTDLVISDISSPNGTISEAADGTILFTPADDFVGDAVITYTVTDPDGQSDTGTATVTVGPDDTGDNGPTAAPDFAETTLNTAVAIDVRGNDFDGEDFPSELTISSPTTSDGTVTITGPGEITYTPTPGFSGTADLTYTLTDTDGNTDIGNVTVTVPCFTPGTKIATPKGERLVEELQVGDRVITRDNGMQEIRWIGKREMSGAALQAAQHLRPVLIRAGALGNDLPMRDMMVSPQHRVLIANDKTALYFEEREVLVAAKHLTDLEGIDVVDVSGTTYIHVMFDQHEVILSDGTWTESFQPGDLTLEGIGDEQRNEILELFPELATEEGVASYAAARRSLKKFEAKLVTN